jgi:hypothetical protein
MVQAAGVNRTSISCSSLRAKMLAAITGVPRD